MSERLLFVSVQCGYVSIDEDVKKAGGFKKWEKEGMDLLGRCSVLI